MSTNSPQPNKSRIDYTASGTAIATQAGNSQSSALLRHKAFLDARMGQISRWVTQGVKPEALQRFALMDMDGDRGAKLRECTPQSIYMALLACAVTGLEPGALKGEAYLVPYRNKGVMEASFMVGYRGIIKQARRSREVSAIWANVVFERDNLEIDLGSKNHLVHNPVLRDRGDIIGAYAIARMANGQDEIEWMDRDDLEAVKKAGNQGPAWGDWGDQMWRKAPYRRLAKRLPLGADYYVALALDHASGIVEQARVLDAETEGEASKALSSGGAAAEMAAQAGVIGADEAAAIERIEAERARAENVK